MVYELQVITTGPTQDETRGEADAVCDGVFGKRKWAMIGSELMASKSVVDPEATKAASLAAGYETKILVTVEWQGRFTARVKE